MIKPTRLCARGILLGPNDTILLVMERHERDSEPFWVLPGGGLDTEDGTVLDCVRREFREETGLTVEVGPLLYLQEFIDPNNETHNVAFIFSVHGAVGALHATDSAEAPYGEDLRRHVQWFTREELPTLPVYPEMLRDEFWRDRAAGVTEVRFIVSPAII